MSKLVSSKKKNKEPGPRSLGPISDLEKHLLPEWWRSIFNSLYLKTDGDVIENNDNTMKEIDLVVKTTNIEPYDHILDLCCGQGRHSLELAKRGYQNVFGIDRSRYLIRLARKRASQLNFKVNFSEGDARRLRIAENSLDTVLLMGNSFGYFERNEDDICVIKEVKRILRDHGSLVLDIVDGEWMEKNFEARSWEWIDQNYLVCRERSLSLKEDRIITREVIIHAEQGILADQFYAERLYSIDTIKAILEKCGFVNIIHHQNLVPHSTRNQDLGMMSNRLFITAMVPEKQKIIIAKNIIDVTVIMGDPHLPDEVKRDGKFNEEDLNTIKTLKDNLKKLSGFKFTFLDNHPTLIKNLLRNTPSFVFNLCDEGFFNDAFKELHVPAILDMLKISYTGAGPVCLATCYNKSFVRSLAANLDIPVPLETYVDPADQAATLPSVFPALLKPNLGDSSLGITKDAVVHNAEQLMGYMEKMKTMFPGRAILVQEFLPGKEYSVGIIGNPGNYQVLPILEVDYSRLDPSLPKILSYESKWLPDSPFWNDIKYKEAELSDEVYRQLTDQSMLLFERLNCCDYARFDYREDANGIVKLLEVNPNPGWCWDGKLNFMAAFRGIKYEDLLEMILNAALERYKLKN